jgi:hypothetical protein
MSDPVLSGGNVNASSGSWGLVKVTIDNPAAAISPASRPCKSAKIYHLSGTATFVAPTAAAATDLPLPTTLAEAFTIAIENLNQLSFFGTAGDVVMIIWRN